MNGPQRTAVVLCCVAAAVLIHGLTVDHTTYDDRFVLYFRSRQLWWQRRYHRNKYFLGMSRTLLEVYCIARALHQTTAALVIDFCSPDNSEISLGSCSP